MALADASRSRQIIWISNEAGGVVTPAITHGPTVPKARFMVQRTTFTNGFGRDEHLAVAHPHVLELTWLPRG